MFAWKACPVVKSEGSSSIKVQADLYIHIFSEVSLRFCDEEYFEVPNERD